MNIYQKLIEVRKVVPYLQKETKGWQFQYTSSSQVLSAVRGKLDELGLLLIPNVTAHNLIVTTDSKGRSNYFTEFDMEMTWVNADKPEEKISVPWYAQGLDLEGEKGVGKALTYAEKYFMLKFFNIPTDKDDPDSFQGEAETPKRTDKRDKRDTPKRTDTPKQDIPKSDINLTGFWASAKNLGFNEDFIHQEASAYFAVENLTSLNDIPNLTTAKINKFLTHLVTLKNA